MCKFKIGEQVVCIRSNRHKETGKIGAAQGTIYTVKDINKCYICGAFHIDVGIPMPRNEKGHLYSSICTCGEFLDVWGIWWHNEGRFTRPEEAINEREIELEISSSVGKSAESQ